MAEDKKTLVILPGWGGSQETWKKFQQCVEPDFQAVYVVDLPCFGNEPCPGAVWGVEEYAAHVERKLQQIAPPSSLVLLGHSFGGQVAAYLTATKPSICDQLILVGAAVFRQKRSIKRLIFASIAKVGKIFFQLPGFRMFHIQAQRLLYRIADSPDYLKTSGVQRQIFQKVIRHDLSSILNKIKVPTLVLWGGHDTYVPLAQGKRLVSYIPDAELATIQGGRHGLHHTHPNELRDHIRSFVNSNTYAS